MLRVFYRGLHFHACFSPFADLDMYPTLIEKSMDEKLDVITIRDCNASENESYVLGCAKRKWITLLSGINRENCFIFRLL
jgi:hypothetical protein